MDPENLEDDNRCQVRYHDQIMGVFAGYGAFVSRHTLFVFSVGLLMVMFFSLGLTVSTTEKDLDELWMEEGTRLREEKEYFEAKFGGLPRKQSVIVTRQDGSSIITEQGLNSLLTVMTNLISEGAADELAITTSLGGSSKRYIAKDFCERPPVPPNLRSGGFVALGIEQLAPCLTGQALSSGWFIDRFPCSRASVLDCFSEGSFDYPAKLKELDAIMPNIVSNSSATYPGTSNTVITQCLGGNVDFSGTRSGTFTQLSPVPSNSLYNYWRTPQGSRPALDHAAASERVIETYRILLETRRWGYYWRTPYKGKTEAALKTHINDAIANNRDTTKNVFFCANSTLSSAKCCLDWSGRKIDEEIVLGDFGGSIPAASFGATKTTVYNYNENHPLWIETIDLADASTRQALVDLWENSLISQLRPDYEKAATSQFATGALYGNINLNFLAWRSFQDTIDDGSTPETPLLIVGYCLMLVYSMFSLARCSCPYTGLNAVYSRMWLGFSGTVIVGLSTLAGFGFTALVGQDLSPISINLVPFLALGIGMDDMYVLTHAMVHFHNQASPTRRLKLTMGVAGPSVFLTSFSNACAFFVAAVTPIPAVRGFAIQMGITSVITYFFLMTLYVPCMVWDARRVNSKRSDICVPPCAHLSGRVPYEGVTIASEKGNYLRKYAVKKLGPGLTKLWVKVLVIFVFVAFTAAMAGVGFSATEEGLRLSDVALRNTYVRDFAELEEDSFGGYESYLVTRGPTDGTDFSSVTKQQSLLDVQVSLQASNWMTQSTRIRDAAWNTDSDNSFYNYEYINGKINNLYTPVTSNFYTDFASWVTTSGIVFNADLYCQHRILASRVDCANFDPVQHNAGASKMIVYNQNLIDHDNFIDAIKDNRNRVDAHSQSDSFMYGWIYQYYEQYLGIRTLLFTVLGYALLGVGAATFLFMFEFYASLILVGSIVMIELQLYGFMSLLGVKLNAFSLVNLVMCIGMAVEFTAHVTHVFLIKHGSRDKRMKGALQEMFAPMTNGCISTLLAVLPLAFARFPFFRAYYFGMFWVMVLLAYLYGMIFLPVVLSLIGPKSFHHLKGEEHHDDDDDEIEMETHNRQGYEEDM